MSSVALSRQGFVAFVVYALFGGNCVPGCAPRTILDTEPAVDICSALGRGDLPKNDASASVCSGSAKAFVWTDLDAPEYLRDFQSSSAGRGGAMDIALRKDAVLLATDRGVWRATVGVQPASWQQLGLNHENVRTLASPRSIPGLLIAGSGEYLSSNPGAVYRSTDGGASWCISPQRFEELRQSGAVAVPVEDIVVADGGGSLVIFANVSGISFARSFDVGVTWNFEVGGALIGGPHCVLHVPEAGNNLFQGCEAPLDRAWIKRAQLGFDGRIAATTDVVGPDDIGNRRPNSFASLAGGAVVYAGLEGAVLRIVDDSWSWFYRSDVAGDGADYIYVRFIWINPCDPDHVVFGGFLNGVPSGFPVLETTDGGLTYRRLVPPSTVGALSEAGVISAAVSGSDLYLLLREGGIPSYRFRVFHLRHQDVGAE